MARSANRICVRGPERIYKRAWLAGERRAYTWTADRDDGYIDFRETAVILREAGFRGRVVDEGSDGDPLRSTLRYLEYLRWILDAWIPAERACPMTQHSEYFLGGTQAERDRLATQAAAYAPEARWLLERVGIPPGARAIDVGCGPIGILDLLAERVGAAGTVVGLEREARFAEMAAQLTAERGLTNVEIVQGDLLTSGLPAASFDVAHERLVLIQAPNPAAILAEMVALVRPGGLVLAEDFDGASWLCHPPHPAWDALMRAFLTVARGGQSTAEGSEPWAGGFIGRYLPDLLRASGLEDVQFEVHVRADLPGEYRRTHLLSLVESVRETIVGRGLLSDVEITELSSALRGHLENPHTVVVRQLLFQAWGSKPD